jgi:hypothetical protein
MSNLLKSIRIEYKGHTATINYEDEGKKCDWINGCQRMVTIALDSELINFRSTVVMLSDSKIIEKIYERYFKARVDEVLLTVNSVLGEGGFPNETD